MADKAKITGTKCVIEYSFAGITAEKKTGEVFALYRQIRTMGTLQTAMIIDDDEDFGRLLSSMLEVRKILALPVQSLSAAEQYLSYMKPTIIFLDNSFPEGLGINFIRQIHLADEEIKIIMTTADPAQWIEQKAKAEGINYFLKKPLSMEAINNVLDQLNLHK